MCILQHSTFYAEETLILAILAERFVLLVDYTGSLGYLVLVNPKLYSAGYVGSVSSAY